MVLTALLAIPLASAQTVKVPCTLAERLDLDTFALLGNYDGSEAGQDSAADDLAQCWAAGLTRDLRQMPKLAARISTLRTLYQQLNSAEGDMAYDMMGGGTMYTHAIPRSFPGIEETLRTLAALAGSTSGAQVGQRYALSVTASSRAFASRVAALKTWKPKDLPDFDRRDFLTSLADYQKAGMAIQKLLGSRGDAATAAGYLPLQSSMFVDEFLNDDSLGSR
ncbi:hypothetical protein MF271_10210 [Deinococcus sp. KNUC1210]|uniref:hypothetical protein n=1 Tax=Deinococcus sp. KNUC1210 TaxID=2917691 RepID=UPI001EEFB743|nr:hypothetical protein [Deinococcus sp. KNUC1210]ULH14412.1 hypothetical protein MF271_10210 [Deinococcus sp. KNUC1210]